MENEIELCLEILFGCITILIGVRTHSWKSKRFFPPFHWLPVSVLQCSVGSHQREWNVKLRFIEKGWRWRWLNHFLDFFFHCLHSSFFSNTIAPRTHISPDDADPQEFRWVGGLFAFLFSAVLLHAEKWNGKGGWPASLEVSVDE